MRDIYIRLLCLQIFILPLDLSETQLLVYIQTTHVNVFIVLVNIAVFLALSYFGTTFMMLLRAMSS